MAFHVLLVPGSWHVPEHYESTITELKSRGVPASTLLLPTNNISDAPITDLTHPDIAGPPPSTVLPDMYTDAFAVSGLISELVDQGNLVLIAVHSYGGLPASDAVSSELTWKSRKEKGLAGGVIGMFAITSFFLPVGMTTMQAVGGEPLPSVPKLPSGVSVVLNPGHNLFNDLSEDEQKYWTSLLRPQPFVVHETPVTNAGFLTVPCGYLKTNLDVINPLANQEMGIAAARSMGADVTEYSVNGGHCAFLADPSPCVDCIVDFGEKCVKLGG